MIRNLPRFLWVKFIIKASGTRPQLSFLPLVKDTGLAKPAPQASLEKTLEIIKKRAEAEKTEAASAKVSVAIDNSAVVVPANATVAV